MGENAASRSRSVSWPRENGRPWPNGVEFEPRPHAAPVGHHQKGAALRRQHPPQLAQQVRQLVGQFQPVHHQRQVDRGIGKRQVGLLDQGCVIEAGLRPVHHPLPRRHEGEHPLGFGPPWLEIGNGIADPEHPRALTGAEARADAMRQHAPRHLPKGACVEFPEIDYIQHRNSSICLALPGSYHSRPNKR